ncbi:MAG: class I SAM-dependent RNA methyltransferase [Anaerolineae bacterium]|nr:class I SAM-dependent RNA methyltransferase [Anaerolineae bacterium]
MGDEIIEVDIEALVYGGDGLGRLQDGRAVFIPFCLPGERVRARVLENKRGHVKAELLEMLSASPTRIRPRCKHFGVCGGCHYQHIEYAEQLEFKRQILVEQLQRIGGIAQPPVEPVFSSPSPWNYRNTVQLHLLRDGKLGFQKVGSHEVIPIEECHLPEAVLCELWKNLSIDPEANIRRVDLRAGENEDVLLVLESDEVYPEEFEADLPISVVHLGPQGPFVLAGDDHVVFRVLGRNFRASAGSFFQVNTRQAEAMVETLITALHLSEAMTLLDVYCGVGLFSAFLAPRVRKCIGIEASPSACEDFAANLDSFENVDLFMGEAERVLPALRQRAEVVVLDPPRAGLTVEVVDFLCETRPEQVAYISCDPATLARDLKKLIAGGFSLRFVKPFDLFPQTYHLESVTLLVRGTN